MAMTESSARVAAAMQRAEEARAGAKAPTSPSTTERKLVVGDPQATADKFFSILDRAGALLESGWLAPYVELSSMGDHFDFGEFEIRESAGTSGTLILSWLAAHPREQVTLIAGNHDLSRVAELFSFDDDTFQRAATHANELYRLRPKDPGLERDFLREYPMFVSVEVAARDLSTFRVEQRELVSRLLRARRFRFASANEGTLLVHAGATRDDLLRAMVPENELANASSAARGLNRVFDGAIDSWDERSPFCVPGFFEPSLFPRGEAGGFLFQRAAQPEPARGEPGPGRRFDPRTLPLGLTQAIGHVRDAKSRALLGSWVRDEAAEEGELRHLLTDGRDVAYARGLPLAPVAPNQALLLFTDGGMNYVPAERYQLLELPC